MSAQRLVSTGVDVVSADIEVARLLSTVVRRDRAQFIVADVYEYLQETSAIQVDITSAFSIFQWLILQRNLDDGLTALRWLFAKTRSVCVLEFGYPSEEIYRDRLPAVIDREWVRDLMTGSGRFDEVRCYEAAAHGLMRDIFVGFVKDSDAPTRGDAAAVAAVVSPLLARVRERPWPELFEECEKRGLHVTPVTSYTPIPELSSLPETTWASESSLCGIDLGESDQLRLLREVFPRYAGECASLPTDRLESDDGFFIGNHMFDGTDAYAYYCMIRHRRPRQLVEVGSGYSAALALRAGARTGGVEIIAIDPQPSDVLRAVAPRLHRLIEQPVQEVPAALFEGLQAGDILFIDSSHVSRVGGDVNHLILEILPRLASGVAVHFHDVFLPFEYPRAWVREQLRFWNEQYVLHAFLAFNSEFRVILANHYLGQKHRDAFQRTFPSAPWWGGGSFWIERCPAHNRDEDRSTSAPRHT
jgi:hypothetical protein